MPDAYRHLRDIAGDMHQDWDLRHRDPDDFVRHWARRASERSRDELAAELDTVVADTRTEDQLEDWWVDDLGSAFDPASVGMTHRQWFVHMRELLRASVAGA